MHSVVSLIKFAAKLSKLMQIMFLVFIYGNNSKKKQQQESYANSTTSAVHSPEEMKAYEECKQKVEEANRKANATKVEEIFWSFSNISKS